MKSIKYLLAAFIVSSMFASCAKDEMVVAPENQNQIVGAELLGTNISVNFGKGVDTKMTADAKWEASDRLGLGWLQADATTPTDKLYANHLFQKSGDNGALVTKGNVYKGWHFGYYPFTYMEGIGEDLVVNINPKQTKTGNVDRYSTSLWLSPRAYLTKEADLDENLQLKTKFDMFQVVKSIVVNVTPDEAVTSDATLKNLDIKSITINTPGKGIFVKDGSVTVKPSELVLMQEDEDGEYSLDLTKEAFYANLNDALSYTWNTTATVKVDNPAIDLSGKQTLRVHTLPKDGMNLSDKVKDFSIVVEVEGGKFVIEYSTEAEADQKSYEKINNAAFDKLVKAYKADGALASYELNDDDKHREGISLELTLPGALFQADFGHISSAEEWNQAVKVSNALQLAKAKNVFTVDSVIVVDADNALLVPTKGFTKVETTGNGVISIESEYNMPKAIADALTAGTAKVLVDNGAVLNIADNNSLKASIVNNGTINVGYKATANGVDNTNGTINVVFGSYLKTIAGKDGIIAYEVKGDDDAAMINYLMENTVADKEVTINTLVVNEGITFDLSMISGNFENPYDQEDGEGLKPALLKQMNIMMNGGVLKSNGGVNKVVKNIEVLAGNNEITNVNAEKLFVKAGSAVLKATAKSGLQEDVKVKDIINHANLTVMSDVYANNYSNPKGAKTVVADDATVWYTTKLTQNGVVEGSVEKFDSSVDVFTVKAITVTTGAAFKNNLTDNDYVSLGANIQLANGVQGIEVSGKVIDGNGYSISTANTAANGKGKPVFNVTGAATIKDLAFAAQNTQYDIVVKSTANDVVIENCTFATATNTAMKNDANKYMGKRAVYVESTFSGNLTIVNCEFNDKVYAFNSNSSTATFNFENSTLNGWMSGNGSSYTFTNCEFGKSGDYADFIPYCDATFYGCTFAPVFEISLRNATNLTFDASNKVGSKYIASPQDIKWSFDGDGTYTAGKAVSVVIAGATYNTTLPTEEDVKELVW